MSLFKTLTPFTQTFILHTNLIVNLKWLHSILDVPENLYERNQTRTRWKKQVLSNPPPNNTILATVYKKNRKGWSSIYNKGTYMRGLSITLYNERLCIMRIPTKGCVHIIGCKDKEHAIDSFIKIYDRMTEYIQSTQRYIINGALTIHIRPAMTNYTAQIDFTVDRYKLNTLINNETEFGSLMTPRFVGLNIKHQYNIDHDQKDFMTQYTIYPKCNIFENQSYQQFLDLLEPERHKKEEKKIRCITFLLFPTGKIIITGMMPKYIEESYNTFIKILEQNKHRIKEQRIKEGY